jgi:hypothetical protein
VKRVRDVEIAAAETHDEQRLRRNHRMQSAHFPAFEGKFPLIVENDRAPVIGDPVNVEKAGAA